MHCHLIAASPERLELFAGILSEEGYDVDSRVADSTGSVSPRIAGSRPMAFVDLALGLEAASLVSRQLHSFGAPVDPLIAAIGEPSTFEDIDAIRAMGIGMYIEADPHTFKKRARFLRGAFDLRIRATALITEVRESELLYRTVATALDEGLLVQQRDGIVTATNPAAGRILGLSDDDVRARRWRDADWEIIDQEGAPVSVDDLPCVRVLRTGQAVRGCVLGLGRRGGKRVWISVNSCPVEDRGSSPVAVVTTFSDVTERRLAEEQLLAVFDGAPDAVIIHREGRTLWANKRWAELLGYDDPKSFVGKPIFDFVSPRFKGTVAERVGRASRGQMTSPSLEQGLLHKDGSEVPVVVYGVFTVFRGEPALAAFARDRTEQRRLELELMATDRLAALGRLAAGVGHEINNPLAYVIGNVQLAIDYLRRADASEAVERLEEALGGAERIRLIVRDLKVFGARIPETLTPVEMHPVVDSCARVAEGGVVGEATLVRDFGDVPPVLASEPRLAQVILNLLVNALQSFPNEGCKSPTVTVSTRVESDGWVALQVADNGSGIEPENLPRVMDPFFTTKADRGGTGLGLSICNMLVADQGGKLTIESQVGRGTTVTVRLRAATANPG